MPARIVREGILSSSRVAQLNWAAEVFYRRLLNIVDDYGRVEAMPMLLRSKCYPLQVDKVRVTDIPHWLAACEQAGLIVLYTVNSKEYLEVQDFRQQLRSKTSKCPAPSKVDPCADA